MPVLLRSRQTGDMYVQVVVETPAEPDQENSRNCWPSSKKLIVPAQRSPRRRVSSPRSRTSFGNRAKHAVTVAGLTVFACSLYLFMTIFLTLPLVAVPPGSDNAFAIVRACV